MILLKKKYGLLSIICCFALCLQAKKSPQIDTFQFMTSNYWLIEDGKWFGDSIIELLQSTEKSIEQHKTRQPHHYFYYFDFDSSKIVKPRAYIPGGCPVGFPSLTLTDIKFNKGDLMVYFSIHDYLNKIHIKNGIALYTITYFSKKKIILTKKNSN
ncbi:MAG: hypothetical protein PSX81_02880 [bacterium]|nr:hypothetical protein [bacterium]